jgi:hypothetical protein
MFTNDESPLSDVWIWEAVSAKMLFLCLEHGRWSVKCTVSGMEEAILGVYAI